MVQRRECMQMQLAEFEPLTMHKSRNQVQRPWLLLQQSSGAESRTSGKLQTCKCARVSLSSGILTYAARLR